MNWLFDFAWNEKVTKRSDGCTLAFDIIFGYYLWKICRLHDWAYRERRLPNGKKIEGNILTAKLYGDWFMMRGIWRRIMREHQDILHLILGLIILLLYSAAVFVLGWGPYIMHRLEGAYKLFGDVK